MENFKKYPTLRRQIRQELGISNDTILIGSFQKDGKWGRERSKINQTRHL